MLQPFLLPDSPPSWRQTLSPRQCGSGRVVIRGALAAVLACLMLFLWGCDTPSQELRDEPAGDVTVLTGVWRVDVEATQAKRAAQGAPLMYSQRPLDQVVVEINALAHTFKVSVPPEQATIYAISALQPVKGSKGMIFSAALNGHPASFSLQGDRLHVSLPYRRVFVVLKRAE